MEGKYYCCVFSVIIVLFCLCFLQVHSLRSELSITRIFAQTGMFNLIQWLTVISYSTLFREGRASIGMDFSLMKDHKIIRCRCHYTKSNPIDDHSNISSKKLQKQNFKPLGHSTCMQCGTSHLQTVQENILSHIILATYMKFTVATVRFTQNVSCNIYTHPRYQQVADITV